MTTLTIEIPDKSANVLVDLIELLGGKVVINNQKKQKSIEVSTSLEANIFDKLGAKVFLNKRKTYDYFTLTKGVVLSSDTYRGFHKIDKNKTGAKEVFEYVLDKNKDLIISEFKKINKEKDIDDLENEICKELKNALKKNIDNRQLNSFNKLRKPLDIVLEHFVAMGNDFADIKAIVTPFLFLPLDSQMFQSDFIFPHEDLKELKIKRNFTFKDIYDKQHYYAIQEYLKNRALKLGFKHRIYLIWFGEIGIPRQIHKYLWFNCTS